MCNMTVQTLKMSYLLRQVVRRQELLQYQLEKAEEVLSAKAEAKKSLAKDVS